MLLQQPDSDLDSEMAEIIVGLIDPVDFCAHVHARINFEGEVNRIIFWNVAEIVAIQPKNPNCVFVEWVQWFANQQELLPANACLNGALSMSMCDSVGVKIEVSFFVTSPAASHRTGVYLWPRRHERLGSRLDGN